MLVTVIACTAMLAFAAPSRKSMERETKFDSDSSTIGVDNRCSVCISGFLEDFIQPPVPSTKVIRGFNHVHTTGIMEGELRYSWQDDDGMVHVFTMPNSIYVPNSNVRLLSPQHWARHYKRQQRMKGRRNYIAEETTDDTKCVLRWGPQSAPFTRTTFLDPNTRVATFATANGFQRYMAFCAKHDLIDDLWTNNELMCYDMGIVSDDKESMVELNDSAEAEFDTGWQDEEPLHQEGDDQPKGKVIHNHFQQFDVTVPISTQQKVFDITASKDTPAATSRVLLRHKDSKPHDQSFNYRSVIGMLGYLTRCSRSDIAYAVHQCARFSDSPRIEHSNAVRWLGRYLLGTMNKGMHFVPDMQQGLEVFVDADFAGAWDPEDTGNRDTARSRYGYIVRLFGCPILWKSSLQTEIALSTTEAEYTGLSHALRDVVPIMNVLKQEMKEMGLPVNKSEADIHCRVFEDNSGAVEIAREKKYRPRTKHLNCKLHHFRGYVESGAISIHPISTTEQPADYLTKSLPYEQFERLRRMIMGW